MKTGPGKTPGVPAPGTSSFAPASSRFSRGSILRDFVQDIRFGLRGLRREPGWTLATLGTLGLAIGATSAIFAVVYGVLLRPLPYPDPDRLVVLEYTPANQAAMDAAEGWDPYMRSHLRVSTTFPAYEALRRELLGGASGNRESSVGGNRESRAGGAREPSSTLLELGVYDDAWSYNVGFGPEVGTERLAGTLVSASLFRALGIPPLVGRWTTDDEDLPGVRGAVLLSHHLWQERFGFRRDLEGATVTVDGVPYTVAGVMPPDFSFPNEAVELWISLSHATRGTGSSNYELVGRLPAQGTTRRAGIRAATAELASRRVALSRGDEPDWEMRPSAASLHRHLVGEVRPALALLFCAVGTLLLIACVNVVNLTLTRATRKEQEHTVRAALGAGPGRLARLFLTESLLVSVLGAVLGVGLAWGLLSVLPGAAPEVLPRKTAIHLDGPVMAFTLGTAVLVGLAVGLVPALHAARLRLVTRITSAARWASRGWGEGRLRDALVVTQLGMALILMVSGALLVRSFAAMLGQETGFDPTAVLTFETALPRNGYPDAESRRAYYQELDDRIRALPGVREAGMTIYLPAGGSFHWGEIEIEGRISPPGEELRVEQKEVTPEYFQAMGMTLLEGRLFESDRVWSDAREVVVTEKLARRYLGGRSPVGRRINTGELGAGSVAGAGQAAATAAGETSGAGSAAAGRMQPDGAEWWTVVGVVADIHYRGATRDVPTVFFPYYSFRGGMDVAMKVDGNLSQLTVPVQRLVAEMDPDVTLYNVMPLQARLGRAVAGPRFQALLVGAFGILSLLLSVVGIYGVMAYAVARRQREMGIRRALGAEAGRLVGRVVFHGFRLTLLGLVVGMVGVFALTGLLEGYLYGLEPHDPATLAAATALLAAASLVACLLPALRAARADPLLALRAE